MLSELVCNPNVKSRNVLFCMLYLINKTSLFTSDVHNQKWWDSHLGMFSSLLRNYTWQAYGLYQRWHHRGETSWHWHTCRPMMNLMSHTRFHPYYYTSMIKACASCFWDDATVFPSVDYVVHECPCDDEGSHEGSMCYMYSSLYELEKRIGGAFNEFSEAQKTGIICKTSHCPNIVAQPSRNHVPRKGHLSLAVLSQCHPWVNIVWDKWPPQYQL